MRRIWALVSVSASLCAASNAFSAEQSFKEQLINLTPPEVRAVQPEAAPLFRVEHTELRSDLSSFYSDFKADGRVSIFVGVGTQFYSASSASGILSSLQAVAQQQHLSLGNWNLQNEVITFEDSSDNTQYKLTVGHTREDFIAALANTEIVIYFGHSRYGRGPAFEEMQNYFRMGDVFPTIEVDTRNRYFLNETMQNTTQYPPLQISLDGGDYYYQYRGNLDHTSELDAAAYTKIIKGMDKDLRAARFTRGRQLFFFDSCSNVNYFKNPFRSLQPDHDKKFVFGSLETIYGNFGVLSAMLGAVVEGSADSAEVLNRMNAVATCDGDAAHCYTTY